nr:glycoside hydrolase family 43 protein [Oleiagrimonas soli]
MNTRRAPLRSARLALAVAALLCAVGGALAKPPPETFVNPLLPSGPDPWVIRHDGFYYYMNTLGNRIALWKTRDLAKLDQVKPVTVWRARKSGPGSISLWAPELHFIDGKWYLYFSAAERGHDDDAHRHTLVLEHPAGDPTQGAWTEKGIVNTNRTGIDSTVFRWRGQLYFVYSAYVGDHSDLILARMKNPWTLTGPQVDIARPTFTWEMQGERQILEAPEFLPGTHGRKVFLTYSASACWSDDYALGLLTADAGADLADASSWSKSPHPVFAKSPAHDVYATGHNGFFTDPDGRHWIIYHANTGAGVGCGPKRSPRMQPFGWHADGTPDFGTPVAAGRRLHAPARADAKPAPQPKNQ